MELHTPCEASSRSDTQNFPAIFRVRRFITVFTRPRHWYLSHARWVHKFLSYFSKIHLNVTFPPTSRSSNGHCPFPLCITPLPMRATCSVHLILLGSVILIIFVEEKKLSSCLLCNFLQHRTISSLLNILFSDILSLCSSLSVRDQVSNPHRTLRGIHTQIKFICCFFRRYRRCVSAQSLWGFFLLPHSSVWYVLSVFYTHHLPPSSS